MLESFKLDAILGAQGKYLETYRAYGERYFLKCNVEARRF